MNQQGNLLQVTRQIHIVKVDGCANNYLPVVMQKKRIFDFRDKPGKSLAYILAETPGIKTDIKMRNSIGRMGGFCRTKIGKF